MAELQEGRESPSRRVEPPLGESASVGWPAAVPASVALVQPGDVAAGPSASLLDPIFSSRRRTALVCQVYGCGKRLSREKEFYQRYRICKAHASQPEVLLRGGQPGEVPQRFCQQCSSFHPVSAFDGKRKSCRERLALHTARRRARSAGAGAAAGAASADARASETDTSGSRSPGLPSAAAERTPHVSPACSEPLQSLWDPPGPQEHALDPRRSSGAGFRSWAWDTAGWREEAVLPLHSRSRTLGEGELSKLRDALWPAGSLATGSASASGAGASSDPGSAAAAATAVPRTALPSAGHHGMLLDDLAARMHAPNPFAHHPLDGVSLSGDDPMRFGDMAPAPGDELQLQGNLAEELPSRSWWEAPQRKRHASARSSSVPNCSWQAALRGANPVPVPSWAAAAAVEQAALPAAMLPGTLSSELPSRWLETPELTPYVSSTSLRPAPALPFATSPGWSAAQPATLQAQVRPGFLIQQSLGRGLGSSSQDACEAAADGGALAAAMLFAEWSEAGSAHDDGFLHTSPGVSVQSQAAPHEPSRPGMLAIPSAESGYSGTAAHAAAAPQLPPGGDGHDPSLPAWP